MDIRLKKSQTLIIAIGVMVFLAVLGWTIVNFSAGDLATNSRVLDSQRAFYLAEAGAQWALSNSSCLAGNITNVVHNLPGGNYSVTCFNVTGNITTIMSTGTSAMMGSVQKISLTGAGNTTFGNLVMVNPASPNTPVFDWVNMEHQVVNNTHPSFINGKIASPNFNGDGKNGFNGKGSNKDYNPPDDSKSNTTNLDNTEPYISQAYAMNATHVPATGYYDRNTTSIFPFPSISMSVFNQTATNHSLGDPYIYAVGGLVGGKNLYVLNNNPVNPIHVGDTNQMDNAVKVRGYFQAGGKWYTCVFVTNTLDIVDVTNPANPALPIKFQFLGGGTACDLFVQVDSNNNPQYVYMADGYGNPPGNPPYGSGVQIVNISNPIAPTWASAIYSAPNDVNHGAYGVYVLGKYLYIGKTNYFEIYDISNPVNPILKFSNSLNGAINIRAVFVRGKYAYVGCGNNGANLSTMLKIYDISNPSNITFMGSYNTLATINHIYVRGRYAYLADSTNGLVILDISDPTNPTPVPQPFSGTSFATGGTANDILIRGNYAYVACGSKGVEIIDVSNPYSPVLSGTYTFDGGSSANGVFLAGDQTFVGGANYNNQSWYVTGDALIDLTSGNIGTYSPLAPSVTSIAAEGDISIIGSGSLVMGMPASYAPNLLTQYGSIISDDTPSPGYAVDPTATMNNCQFYSMLYSQFGIIRFNFLRALAPVYGGWVTLGGLLNGSTNSRIQMDYNNATTIPSGFSGGAGASGWQESHN